MKFLRSLTIVWMSAHPAKCTAAHLDWLACCVWQHERSCALESKSTSTHASLKGKHTSPVTPQPPFFPFSLIVTFPWKVPCYHIFKQCSRECGRVSEQHGSYISSRPHSETFSTPAQQPHLSILFYCSHLFSHIYNRVFTWLTKLPVEIVLHFCSKMFWLSLKEVYLLDLFDQNIVKIVILWNIITI